MLTYKGYTGEATIDTDAGILHGRVLGLRDVITFQADTVAGLRMAFAESIDEYLDWCRERNEEPDRPFSGNFLVRVSPELHRQASIRAELEGRSLNQLAGRAFEFYLQRDIPRPQLVRMSRMGMVSEPAASPYRSGEAAARHPGSWTPLLRGETIVSGNKLFRGDDGAAH